MNTHLYSDIIGVLLIVTWSRSKPDKLSFRQTQKNIFKDVSSHVLRYSNWWCRITFVGGLVSCNITAFLTEWPWVGSEGYVRRVSPPPLLSVEALRVVMFVTGYECSHACSSGMADKK